METQQPTVRQINNHLASMASYCVVYANGFQARISRARTHKGAKQGRVINFSYSGANAPNVQVLANGTDWCEIPVDATVELT